MLKIQGIHRQFGKSKILKGINLNIEQGEKHALIGPNGAGKSTLFNVITGKYAPTQGKIMYKGQDISGKSPHKITRLGLGRSFQIINVFNDMTVYQNIRSAVLIRRGIHYNFFSYLDGMKEIEKESRRIIEDIGLHDNMETPANELSYGAQRALEIGLSLATNPDLLLLDEPGAGLSKSETKQVVELIRMVTKDKTLFIVEHDMDVVFALADRISVLYYGEIIVTDVPQKIKENQKVKEIYLGETTCA
jgi:branched-chain amino acid transport system ATP-binding protein